MPSAPMLLPTLSGRNVTVDAFLKNPMRITEQVAKLADHQLIAQHLFHTLGQPVEGGGVLWASIQSKDELLAAGDVGPRSPGAEYSELQPVLPEPRLSQVEDYGATITLTEEDIRRNDLAKLDLATIQLANSITMKLDRRAFAALDDEMDPALNLLAPAGWDTVTLDGASPSPALSRPSAAIGAALRAFELDELGVVGDTLICHPDEAFNLRALYGENLQAMLDSLGLTMVSNPRATAGTALVVQAGECGVVAFEQPLTTRVIPNEKNRTVTVQTFCVPAYVPNHPRAARRITGCQ
ncbi:major capsid protein [Tsukamurella tyrosinosolvens]|uniref:major capsid protein n=1 Tax=Tsukamurella tyrosinosolvens TaxID=57704 RepID=UPI000CA1F1D8|nr:major capsid protein [Tsukamurella tyrosinosolvens]AUN40917.1 hypothetical protein ASU32_13630 [Tsukamurella tyrosinosolvens]